MSGLLAPSRGPRPYAVFAYLLLGLPLGILDFTVVVTGLSVGLGMVVTVVGIPLLVVSLLVVRALAPLERRLAWSLLGAPMPRRAPDTDDEHGLFWARLRSLLGSRRTWAELGFLLLRLPLGVVEFTLAASVVSLVARGAGGAVGVGVAV